MDSRPLYIPVILGTSRKGRMSAYVGRLLASEVAKQAGIENRPDRHLYPAATHR